MRIPVLRDQIRRMRRGVKVESKHVVAIKEAKAGDPVPLRSLIDEFSDLPYGYLETAIIRYFLNETPLRKVSFETGFSYGTLKAIRDGKTHRPRVETIQTLLRYFQV